MAASDAKAFAQKGVAYRITFPIHSTTGALITGATGLDSEISKDGGTFADCTNEAGEIATSSGVYALDLTSTEMNADTVAIIVKTSSANAIIPVIVLYPEEAGDIRVNVTQMAADVVTASAIATDAIGSAELAAAGIAEIQSGLATSGDVSTLLTAVLGLAATVPSAAVVAEAVLESEIAVADDVSAAGTPTVRRRLRQLWQDNVKR
jgi:hypothetical protein